MSTTIAVSLITAISTMAGAGISGYVAFLISRNQGHVQIATIKSQQFEQQAMGMRQIRRDAYLQYLNQLGTVEEILNNAWMSFPPTAEDELKETIQSAVGAMGTLRSLANLVILEGSGKVRTVAVELSNQVQNEYAEGIRTISSMTKNAPPSTENRDGFAKLHAQRSALKVRWISAARESLDDIPKQATSQKDVISSTQS